MEKVYDNCCGIDVYKKLIAVCFKCGSRQLSATTRELLELADWLLGGGCCCRINLSVKFKMSV